MSNHQSKAEFLEHLNALKGSTHPIVLSWVKHIENMLPTVETPDCRWCIEDALDQLREMDDNREVEDELSYHIDFLRSLIRKL